MGETFGLRAATAADAESVLALSHGVYDGFDYLPNCLDDWLNMDTAKRVNHVLQSNSSGEVVGFQSFSIQRGGSVFVQQALRVDPKRRGQGLSKTFNSLAYEDIKDRSSRDQISLLKVLFSGTISDSVLYSDDNGVLLCRRGCFIARQSLVDVGKIKEVGSKDRKPLIAITLKQVEALLRANERLRRIMLSDDYLVVDWVPYHLDDFDQISSMMTEVRVLVDDVSDPRSASVVSMPFATPGVLRSNVDVYTADDDINAAKDHVVAYLNIMAEYNGHEKPHGLQVACDLALQEETLDVSLKKYERSLPEMWVYSKDI